MPALNLTIGQTATRSTTVAQAHVDAYAEITGDRNPLHFDADFASKTKFGRWSFMGGSRSASSTPSLPRICLARARSL